MIEVVTDISPTYFLEKVNKLLNEGYKIKNAECTVNTQGGGYPFIYTAILIKP